MEESPNGGNTSQRESNFRLPDSTARATHCRQPEIDAIHRPLLTTPVFPEGINNQSPPSEPESSNTRLFVMSVPLAGVTNQAQPWVPKISTPPWAPPPSRAPSICHPTAGTAKNNVQLWPHRARGLAQRSPDRGVLEQQTSPTLSISLLGLGALLSQCPVLSALLASCCLRTLAVIKPGPGRALWSLVVASWLRSPLCSWPLPIWSRTQGSFRDFCLVLQQGMHLKHS